MRERRKRKEKGGGKHEGGRSVGKLIVIAVMVNLRSGIESGIGKRMVITRERGKGVSASQAGNLRNMKEAQEKRVAKMIQIPKMKRKNLPVKRRWRMNKRGWMKKWKSGGGEFKSGKS